MILGRNLVSNCFRASQNYRLFSAMADKLKVIVFMGSVREGRLCDRVTSFVKNGLEKRGGFEVETFDPMVMPFELIRQPLHFYSDPTQAPDWLKAASEKIKNADGYVVVSGEYNCTIPPALTNMMDHFSPASYKRKPTAIVTYSPSGMGGARAGVALRPFLAELGSVSIPGSLTVAQASNAVTPDGKTENDTLQKRMESLVEDLEWYASALKAQANRASVKL